MAGEEGLCLRIEQMRQTRDIVLARIVRMNDIDFIGLTDSGKPFGGFDIERTFHFHLKARHAEVVHLLG